MGHRGDVARMGVSLVTHFLPAKMTKIPSITGIEPSQAKVVTSCSYAADEAIKDLRKIKNLHQWDPNLPQQDLDAINEAATTNDQEKAAEVDKSFLQDSPYESVRAAVRNTDGGEVANTVRAWVLGMIFVTLGSGLNMFLSMRSVLYPLKIRPDLTSYRSPAISFPAIVVQLLVYPVASLWARVMPTRVFNTFGLKWTLNTGPFTIKEHTVITVSPSMDQSWLLLILLDHGKVSSSLMVRGDTDCHSVSIGYAYSTDALLALKAKREPSLLIINTF